MEVETKERRRYYYFFKTYWKTIILIFTPFILLPIIISDDTKSNRCVYLMLLMTIYWISECIPTQITAMIPMLLLPFFGIMDSDEVCLQYMGSGVITVMSNMILGLVAEYSLLYTRLAYLTILHVGCNVRKLTFVVMLLTMIFSLFMTNWAIAALFAPWARSILFVLEAEGVLSVFYPTKPTDFRRATPTPFTITFYLGIAYAATFGGIGTLLGSGLVRFIKKRIEKDYGKDVPKLNDYSWIGYHVPLMLLFCLLTWGWLQILHLGMFRPKSEAAKMCKFSEDKKKNAIENIKIKLKNMGKFTAHEIWVCIFLCTVYAIHILESPNIFPGWRSIFTKTNPATMSVLFIVLFFIFPAKWDCLNFFNSNSLVPKSSSSSMIIWRYINEKLKWSIIFVVGSGYALNVASHKSKLDENIGIQLSNITAPPLFFIILILSLFSAIFSNIGPESISANPIYRAAAVLARKLQIHPYYFLIPPMVSSTFAFMLPSATPPNAIAASHGNIKATKMIISGIIPTILCVLLTSSFFPTYGLLVYPEISEFPSWGNGTIITARDMKEMEMDPLGLDAVLSAFL